MDLPWAPRSSRLAPFPTLDARCSVREWYRQVRALNKTALPFLIGTKYDVFYSLDHADQVGTGSSGGSAEL